MVGPGVFQYDQRVRARTRLVLATIARDSAANRSRAVIVQHQGGMSTRAAEPALDSVLRFCDRGAHGMLSGRAVGVGRRAGNAAFPLQALAQLIVGLSHMLAQNVSAGGLVLAKVAHWTIRLVGLSSCGDSRRWRRAGAIRGSGRLARDQAAHPQCDHNTNYNATNCKDSSHPSPNYGTERRSFL